MKGISQDLSKDDLLQKCLHGDTHNANEESNHLIWDRCPKTTFLSKKIVEIAVSSAAINFNSGMLGLADIFSHLGISAGQYFNEAAAQKDTLRFQKQCV